MRERAVAACDGASKGNPGPAGWAWVIADAAENPVRWEAGPLGRTTNNVAELTALERLLASTDPEVPLDGRSVEFRYVPAHQVDGDRLNDFADRAASQAAVVQEAAGSALGSPEPPPAPDVPTARKAPRRGSPGAARKSGGSSARTIKAKFPGRCLCGRAYAAGEPIAKNGQGWGHPECRTVAAG